MRTPSFAYKDEEARRVRRTGHELGVRHPVWSVNDKDDAHAWARRLGLRVPRLLGEHPDVTEVRWADLPDRAVLKPVKGAASRGVLLLERTGDRWRDLHAGEVVTTEELTGRHRALADAGTISREVIVEELVQDPQRPGMPPVDWKVHCFFGHVGLVLAKSSRRRPEGPPAVGWRLFDDGWNDLGAAVGGHPVDEGIRPPVHAEELLRVARLVSAAVPRAFLRVDLYDGADGVVFGEITPEPGNRHLFRRDVDRRMGELWEEAEARLLLRCTAAGALEPADGPLPESAVALDLSTSRG
ncbi:MAG: hypothetical protein AVDCRST_MAG35-2409 [uncultured Quadrisphaera sp.]|uniref:ATP-grasp domain-containing protein n=1 Tax=uncultured Quadrisphaera sp. TaxID=904978 RepID=A0A6J4PWK8_9ACTN|nr:MAG: hypothetical protein AVDCRST_MAG35-2409 [uncultured Quadrisphaera sp.]